MKKMIIFGFFTIALLVSLMSFRAVQAVTMGEMYVNFREASRDLTDKEVADRGYEYDPERHHVDHWKIKETYTRKSLFEIEVKRDTLDLTTLHQKN